jgi:redox-sensitive bicupin YhaK (pirin superfamily)
MAGCTARAVFRVVACRKADERRRFGMVQYKMPRRIAMTTRTVRQLVPAVEITEGAGVTVHRTIGTPALKNLDPFLLLDHFGSENPDDYIAGFPDHPHRGFVTLTYMLDGHMEHRDSMGNRGDLRAGGAQWMKAASGVIHSEMPKQSEGRMRGFQLWINLPAAEKMSDPVYQEFSPAAIPEVRGQGRRVRLLAGEYAGNRGVVDDPNTEARYLDVALEDGATFDLSLPDGQTAFVYVYEGDARLGAAELTRHHLAVLSPGDTAGIVAGSAGARFIFVAGFPLKEPVVQYGPFVMNTRDEIEQALADYRDGRLVRAKAAMTGA